MRIFIDTNVLISAALFPNGVAANAFERAVSTPNDPIVSDYVIDELRLLTPGDNRHQASGDSVHFQPDDIGQCAGIRKC